MSSNNTHKNGDVNIELSNIYLEMNESKNTKLDVDNINSENTDYHVGVIANAENDSLLHNNIGCCKKAKYCCADCKDVFNAIISSKRGIFILLLIILIALFVLIGKVIYIVYQINHIDNNTNSTMNYYHQ